MTASSCAGCHFPEGARWAFVEPQSDCRTECEHTPHMRYCDSCSRHWASMSNAKETCDGYPPRADCPECVALDAADAADRDREALLASLDRARGLAVEIRPFAKGTPVVVLDPVARSLTDPDPDPTKGN